MVHGGYTVTFRAPRRRFAHPRRGQPYYEVNSRRGVDQAVRGGYRWIDLDCHTTSGPLVITHYPLPLRHGFIDPKGKVRPFTPIWELAWKQVRRLVANPGRYKINRAKSLVSYALRRGLKVELELKDRRITQKQLEDLRAHIAKQEGLDTRDVQVKVGIWIPGHLNLLERAHAAGFTTILLIHRGDPRHVPHEASAYIDYYRGKAPRWV